MGFITCLPSSSMRRSRLCCWVSSAAVSSDGSASLAGPCSCRLGNRAFGEWVGQRPVNAADGYYGIERLVQRLRRDSPLRQIAERVQSGEEIPPDSRDVLFGALADPRRW